RMVRLMDEEDKAVNNAEEIARQFAVLLNFRDAKTVEDLRQMLPVSGKAYDPEDPTYRMLHLTYLQARFPDVYEAPATWQPLPRPTVDRILSSYPQLGSAYRTGDPDRFEMASEEFFNTVQKVSEEVSPYPGEDTVGSRVGALLTGGALNPPGQQLLGL